MTFLEDDGRQVKYATLLSGGLDSSVLAREIHPSPQVAVTVDYGQSHAKEVEFAKKCCDELGIKNVVVKVRGITGGSLMGSGGDHSGPESVVPFRNMILLSLVANIAVSEGCCRVAIGCSATDEGDYPDCRREFLENAGQIMGSLYGIRLCYPFVNMSKSEIYGRGKRLGVSLEKTWSCYLGGDAPCGQCGACLEVSKSRSENE